MTRARHVERAASCLQCRWASTAANAQANAARHHDATGHQVELVVTTVYGDEQQPAEQTDLLTELARQGNPS